MARSIEEIKNDIAMVEKAIKEIDKRKEKGYGQFSPEEIAQMYSLDPKAAEFFANKQINEDRAASMALRAAAAGKNKEATLEQKTRLVQTALNRAKTEYDNAVKSVGQNSPLAIKAKKLYDELTIEMQSNDPNVNAAFARAGQNVPVDIETDASLVDVQTIRDAISNAVFNKSTGVLENIDDLTNSIEDWRVKNGISTEDPTYKGLIKLLEDKSKGKDITAKVGREEEKEKTRIEERDEDIARKYEDEYGQLAKTLTRFRSLGTPNSTDKRQLLNVILRKETGAAIASDEFRNMLMGFMDPTKAQEFSNRWDAFVSSYVQKGNAILNAIGEVIRRSDDTALTVGDITGLVGLISKYLPNADANKMINYANDMMPSDYYDYVNTTNKSVNTTNKSDNVKQTNEPTVGDDQPFDPASARK